MTRDIMLDKSIISFHGFSSGVVTDAYAVNRRILMSKGIISGNAMTAVKDAFCWVLMAIEVIRVSKKDRPMADISPVTKNHPIRKIGLPAMTNKTNQRTRKIKTRRRRL